MALIKVNDRFQITLPAKLREQLALEIGDLLEAEVQNGTLTLSPKTLIDRDLDLARAQIKEGQFLGPFETAHEGGKTLRQFSKSHKQKARTRRRTK